MFLHHSQPKLKEVPSQPGAICKYLPGHLTSHITTDTLFTSIQHSSEPSESTGGPQPELTKALTLKIHLYSNPPPTQLDFPNHDDSYVLTASSSLAKLSHHQQCADVHSSGLRRQALCHGISDGNCSRQNGRKESGSLLLQWTTFVDHFYYSRLWPSSLTSVTMWNNVLVKINYIGHGVAFPRRHSSASA